MDKKEAVLKTIENNIGWHDEELDDKVFDEIDKLYRDEFQKARNYIEQTLLADMNTQLSSYGEGFDAALKRVLEMLPAPPDNKG
jgi:hypothetical protein